MWEYVATLAVERYGPIALLALVLWRRQTALIRAVITLAEEQPDVDEDRIERDLRRRMPDGGQD